MMSDLDVPTVYTNLTVQELAEIALERNEAVRSRNGALSMTTGSRTGRSPKDRYLVKDALTETTVDWGDINQPIDPSTFTQLWNRVTAYLEDKDTFVSELSVGADDRYTLPVKVVTELAWHSIFAHHMFIRTQQPNANNNAAWTIISAPGFVTDPQRDGVRSDACLMINFSERKVLLAGLKFAGELKKAMFSVMNFLLPARDVLPMHCAANVGPDDDVALFFGLSGTGKTTLSADPERFLIGDDEHGWSPEGVFNFEGGCYAKCINLSQEREPLIWNAICDNAIMENVMLRADGTPDYDDDRYTQNTRAAYPLDHIEKRVLANQAGIPKAVIFLTCDLYGVLPPVSLLTREQAAYHFLSGYTALVGSTEMGSAAGIKETFSRCYGAAFFPRPASVYAELLMKRLDETQAQVYLINTGWTQGGYGKGGERFSIPTTRAVVRAALSGELRTAETTLLSGFNLRIPTAVEGVDPHLLNPSKNWSDANAYQHNLQELITRFKDNFAKFNVSEAIKNAGPTKN
jgi:phosphoenolpyruvate carboxykinase (ATP)